MMMIKAWTVANRDKTTWSVKIRSSPMYEQNDPALFLQSGDKSDWSAWAFPGVKSYSRRAFPGVFLF